MMFIINTPISSSHSYVCLLVKQHPCLDTGLFSAFYTLYLQAAYCFVIFCLQYSVCVSLCLHVCMWEIDSLSLKVSLFNLHSSLFHTHMQSNMFVVSLSKQEAALCAMWRWSHCLSVDYQVHIQMHGSAHMGDGPQHFDESCNHWRVFFSASHLLRAKD